MSTLTPLELRKVVYDWIGVSGGYLGDFTHKSHAEFYSLDCNLDIDPSAYEGTIRERFIKILRSNDASIQAKILRGVLARFTEDSQIKPESRNQKLQQELLETINRLEGIPIIGSPTLHINIDIVEKALSNAETLIQNQDAISAVDRIHTALHGYFLALCQQSKYFLL